MSLAVRDRRPEIMDRPDLDPEVHRRALSGLARLNVAARSASLIFHPVAALARELGRPLEVLDVASGAGDLPIALALHARRAKLPLRVRGSDRSATAIDHAARAAKERSIGVEFVQLDALAGALPAADVLTNSLFLHHLDRDEAVQLLRSMAAAARIAVVACDLLRSRLGFALAYAASRALTTSSVVRFDALASVRAAWSLPEIEGIAREAGLAGATIERVWPERFRIVWRRR